MNTRILIPVKALHLGKSRLATSLGHATRTKLCEALLRRTLDVAVRIAPVTVVTSDGDAAAISIRAGAAVMLEPASLGLNYALTWARERMESVDNLVILPIDLPHLSSAELDELCGQSGRLLIAPDRHGFGTNLLVLPRCAMHRFVFSFGANSAELHCMQARRVGVEPIIRRLPGTVFDVDEPDDYKHLLRATKGGYQWSVNRN